MSGLSNNRQKTQNNQKHKQNDFQNFCQSSGRKYWMIGGVVLSTIIGGTSVASAALPPIYESAREFSSIMNSKEIIQQMNGHLIKSVSNNGSTAVMKSDDGCQVEASLVTIPFEHPGWCGSRLYKIVNVHSTGCEMQLSDNTAFQTRLEAFRSAGNMINQMGNTFSGGVEQIEYISSVPGVAHFALHGRNRDNPNYSVGIEVPEGVTGFESAPER